MDDVESIELDEESIDDEVRLEDFGPPCTITMKLQFKSGLSDVISFRAPTLTPIYAEPITGESILSIIASAYAFGEAPCFSIPTDNDTIRFFDLGSTDFVEVSVKYD